MKHICWKYILYTTLLIGLNMACSKSDKAGSELAVGDEAPIFEGKDSEGKLWKSSDYTGNKILVVYFYPAAMTGG